MNAVKSIGAMLVGIAFLIGAIIAIILFVMFGTAIAFIISPFVNWLAGVLFVINLMLLLVAIIPGARGVSGLMIYISSYVYGLSAWIYGLAVTLTLWGWLAVIIGLLMGGIGVVPIGMLAAAFNGRWDIFWTLLFTVILTYGSRVVGYALASNADNQDSDNSVIDIVPDDDQRTWKDLV